MGQPFATARPSIGIQVQDFDLAAEITSSVVDCEVELSRSLADKIALTIANPVQMVPGFAQLDEFIFTDSALFQPGNEISVAMGYGGDNTFLARGIIQKYLPHFPRGGVPTLSIVALDASVRLMDSGTAQQPRCFADDIPFDDIVRIVLSEHLIAENEIDSPDVKPSKSTVKKAGMTDYQFLRALANVHGFDFNVYYDNDAGLWKANWREPRSDQASTFDFTYRPFVSDDERPTLFSFRPEYGLRQQPSEVKVFYFDEDTKAFLEATTGEDEEAGDSTKFDGGSVEASKLDSEILVANKFRIAAGDVAIEVVPERHFSSLNEAQLWAERYFARKKDNFMVGEGETTGVPDLRAGHRHNLNGIGHQMSGEWEFTTVTHRFSTEDGYDCDFFAHKVLQ